MKRSGLAAIVTGAGRNIGEGISKTLASAGAKVAVVGVDLGVDQGRGGKVAAEIVQAGRSCREPGRAHPGADDRLARGRDQVLCGGDPAVRGGDHSGAHQGGVNYGPSWCEARRACFFVRCVVPCDYGVVAPGASAKGVPASYLAFAGRV